MLLRIDINHIIKSCFVMGRFNMTIIGTASVILILHIPSVSSGYLLRDVEANLV